MNAHTAGTTNGSHDGAGSERLQDLLIISSFGFWALMLGFMPVAGFRMLMGV